MFDYHIHSNLSFDAYDSAARIAMTARDQGLREICFTEHQEIDYPYEEIKPELDWELYDRELKKARNCAPEITIKKGVEVSLMPASLDKISADIGAQELDFVIASQHTVKEKDPYFGDCFEGKTLRQAQREYLEEMLYTLQRYENFDVVGHIGYIDKYLPEVEAITRKVPFEYRDFRDLLDAIFLSLISRGKGVEVNTSNYYVYDWPTPKMSVLKRFVELGGEIVTIGSDAHFADAIGYRFDDAKEYMQQCGIKYICTFENRHPSFVPLEMF
ncbi:MAG: histidinol-phosphatase HisJ family protein [Christensenella sp.]|nr:histidinol-phosphatase HisJ family protein [Christensenella sp.]